MKILIVSDPPTSISAYGQQMAFLIPRLRAANHDVALLATGGSAGATYHLADGTKVYPTWTDPRGNDSVVFHAKNHRADLVFTLGDPHVFHPHMFGQLPWLAWAPLDFESPTLATCQSLKAAKWVWSPSKAGTLAYEAAGIKARHVPHGVDGEVFALADRQGSRRAANSVINLSFTPKYVNILDSFLIVAVAANKGTPSRKGFFEMMSAMKVFSDRHQDARLYVHTETSGIAGGENLYDIMKLVGLDKQFVYFPPQYEYLCGEIPPETLADIYRAADVYLSTSHGEGFGLGALESQMAGTPVILSRNTAQTELCLTGHAVRTEPYMPFDGATLWRRPAVSAIVEALESMYDRRHETPNREVIRDRVLRYEVNHVFERDIDPALKEIEAEVSQIKDRVKSC